MAIIKPEDIADYESSPESIKKWIRIFGNVWPFDNRDYWGDLIFAHKLRVMIGEISEEESPKIMADLKNRIIDNPSIFIKLPLAKANTGFDDLINGPQNREAWRRYENGTLIDNDEVAEWFGQQLLRDE
jgi:hypothetical protein